MIFIKLGGSLITDKRESEHFNAETMARAAREIANARMANPELGLLLGHGSGSCGHVAAAKYDTANGVRTGAEWRGFAEVAVVARRLNNLVIEALYAEGLPIFPVSPSASAHCVDGELLNMDDIRIQAALERGLIPLVHGDVAFDDVRGGTIISTEAVFFYLAEVLRPTQILLLGETEGVYDATGQIFPKITPGNFTQVAAALGGSGGVDVTGGMASKVRTMLALTQRLSGLQIYIFGGNAPGQIEAALMGESPGTLISAE